MRIHVALALLATAFAIVSAGCSPVTPGWLTLEARGAIAFGHGTGDDDGTSTSQIAGFSQSQGISGEGVPDFGTRGRAIGVQAAIQTEAVDLLAGFEQRRIEGESVPETSIGLRKRIGDESAAFYVFALARNDREHTEPDSGFNGTSIGIGLLIRLPADWFFDCNVAYEQTSHLAIEPGHSRMEEGVMQFGFGYSF